MAVSGANFAVAETGTLVVVESEGNGRMCLTLPEVLVSVVGIEKVVPTWADLDPLLRLLPRSSTGERMNPYTSTWTGVTPGDGPQEVHVVLLDNGRTSALADDVGRQALRCIRCSACLNVCPVYERVGGHAYGSVYPGPIGAILNPLLHRRRSDPQTASLPYASIAVRRVLRRLPGPHRHPVGPRRPARGQVVDAPPRRPRAEGRGVGDARGGLDLLRLAVGSPGPSRPRSRPAGCWRRFGRRRCPPVARPRAGSPDPAPRGRGARPARAADRVLPRLVAADATVVAR